MSYNSLEELLCATDLSDDSDGEPSDSSCATLPLRGQDKVDYAEVFNEILQDADCSSPLESAGEISPHTPFRGTKAHISNENSQSTGQDSANKLGPTRITSFSRSSSICTNGTLTLSTPQRRLDNCNETQENEETDSFRRATAFAADVLSTYDAIPKGCQCRVKYSTAIGRLVNTPASLLSLLRPVVRRELDTEDNAHKLAYFQRLRRPPSDSASVDSDPDVDSERDEESDSINILDPSRLCLDSLGLSYKPIEAPKKSDQLIRCRHNISAALEKLRLFNDDFIPIDATRINGISSPSDKKLVPSCVATSNNLLVVGTTNGSLLVCDISNHNTKRHFKSNDDDPNQSDVKASKGLVWQEVDCQDDVSVTCVDVLPETNWICVGYGNGMVKLLRLNKDAVQSKASDIVNTDAPEGAASNEAGTQGRGFGIMADAVSSAFGNFRKSGPHVICSSKPFDDAITACRFTVGESHDEILCANSSTVSILSYVKTVLSHNLTVKSLEQFSDKLLDNDDVVDVACLSSNPQSKYITGVTVSGLVALATIKRCVVIATRPELSVLFRVPFTDHAKDTDGSGYAIPSITWMVLNNSGDIMPVFLIVLGSRISFTLCNLATAKRGGPPVTCTHLGFIKFDTVIRNVHTISRDMLAVMDLNNVIHILQVNVFHNVMYYDIVRSIDLGTNNMADLWKDMVNIGPTISVHVRTVKMMANSYKKFSALVSEIFHNKRNETFFDLRVVSFYILTSKGIWTSEIHSWIKSIGDLTATKHFGEAFAISYALNNSMLPGLLDYTAYIDNIQKLIVYVLHQSCAHIIRLSKLIDSESMTVMDEDSNDGWTDRVKDDISSQIDHLCCSMFDICLRLNLYDCMNDLIHRCFATVGMQHVFVKYVLLNYHNNRMDLVRLKPVVFESILDFYDRLLDTIQTDYLSGCEQVQDLLLILRDEVEHRHKGMCPETETIETIAMNERALVYEILCNHIAKLYVFCSRNDIAFNKERAVCILSKHSLWQVFVYCPELIGDDISVAIEILYSETSNRIDGVRKTLSPSAVATGNFIWENTEGLYVARVLYSILNSLLTFDNCGLPPESAVTNFCKVLGYLTSSSTYKPAFPLTCEMQYARSKLMYDEETIDFDNMERLSFETTCDTDWVSPSLQMLMSFSPRLLFTCFANLLMAPNSTFETNTELLGSKIDIFNFVINTLIGCLNTFEGSQSTFTIRCMLSMLILGVSSFSDSFYLSMRTQVVAIYTLLTEVCDANYDPFLEPGEVSTKELVLPDGSFNNAYFLHTFCKKSDQLFDNVRQFNITAATTRNLLKLHIRRSLCAIYRKFDCQPNWTQNTHFGNIKRLCAGVLPLICDFETRVFLCEVTGDYGGAIKAWEAAGGTKVFSYIQQYIDCIKSGIVQADCSVRELLLLDPSVQKDFVVTLMDALPHLIKVDLKSATALLVEIFSLSNLASLFKETALQSSQDIVLSALKDTPELQLMVLNALLGASKQATGTGMDSGSGDYFKQYLRLLCKDDPKSVCPFLKRQQKLDIGECLAICTEAKIHDAVSYLLMRAGDFSASARWLVDAMYAVGDDIDWCHRLVHDASTLCIKFADFTSHDNLELLWFGILKYLVEHDPMGERFGTLIEEVFNNGIYKFTRLTNALFELKKYDSANVNTFKGPLRRLLCDLEFQIFVSNASSSMSTTVLRDEFRRSLGHNKQGVVITSSTEDSPKSHAICGVCRRSIWALVPSDDAFVRDASYTNAGRNMSQSTVNLSPLERQLGVIVSLVQPLEKQSTESSIHISDLYSDRLSTLVTKKTSGGVGRPNWSCFTSELFSQLALGMKKHTKDALHSNKSVHVFWCGHMFHTACAPNQCPTCGLGD
ncbi:vacuolar sorting-associated protein 8, putative [Babesia ovis]|uniref:Vacuolar sorting-associated protein 8, putative n=1 Tax=Babesia ovis TaxID=5869 RepID=A0A9W5T9C4_BABOV|nr:vacuolar sorting-associated protein 8, putative [Babesia ovis]